LHFRKGKIIIGDNPHADADFAKLLRVTSLDAVAAVHNSPDMPVEVVDLRFWTCDDLRYYGFRTRRKRLRGDPSGELMLNLGKKSKLYGINPILLRGTYSKRWETIKHHHGSKQEYCYSRSIFDADVYVSIPKLKAHCKVGATLNIKGLVGAIANKNTLVHWRIGFPLFGGDEYPSPPALSDYPKLFIQHFLNDFVPERVFIAVRDFFRGTSLAKKYSELISTSDQRAKVLRGAWDGNDSIWRMTVDIYNLFVCDHAGYRAAQGKRFKSFSVVDGIIGGSSNGPHFPEKVESGVILAGADLLAVDTVACRLMDFDLEAIPYLSTLLRERGIQPKSINVVGTDVDLDRFFDQETRHLNFRAPYRWPHLNLWGNYACTNRYLNYGKGEVQIANNNSCCR